MNKLIKALLHFNRKYWVYITVTMLVAVCVLSLYPAAQLPKVPGTDKTHHFIAYCALATPITLARPKHWLLMCLGLIAVSGLIELIQPYQNRYGEWLDLLANSFGVSLSVICSSIILLLWKEEVDVIA